MPVFQKAQKSVLGKKFGVASAAPPERKGRKQRNDEDDEEELDEEAVMAEFNDGSDASDQDEEDEHEESSASEGDEEEGEDQDDDAALPKKAARKEAAAATTDVTQLKFVEPAEWVERMALVATKPLPTDLNPDDDPKREEVFMQHTLLSAQRGITMLERADVPWRRPEDYFAEMFKSDVHMDKIQQSILKSKREVEQRMHRRAMKEQKKFGKEVQAEVLRQRSKFKKDMMDKVAQWRKKGGRGEDLDELLDDEEGGDGKGGRGGRGGKRGGRGGAGGRGGGRPKPPGRKSLRPGKNKRRRNGK